MRTYGIILQFQIVFSEVTNYGWLSDAELPLYSPCSSHWICFYVFEHCLGIHGFKPTWPCLIEVLANREKYLEPHSVICCAYNSHTTYGFCYFRDNMTNLNFIKTELPQIDSALCSSERLSNLTGSEAMYSWGTNHQLPRNKILQTCVLHNYIYIYIYQIFKNELSFEIYKLFQENIFYFIMG